MRYREALALVTLLVICFAGAGSAVADGNRFALLSGNQAYDSSVGVLHNPHNDVAVVGAALKAQGFEILLVVENADRTVILGAVRELARHLKVAGSGAICFLYYSGHGVAEQDTNVNYLIPVDVTNPGSAAFWDKRLKLDEVLQLLDLAPHAVKFVVFDACRSELQMPTKDLTKGLVPIAEQKGFFIAYSTAPGRAASDRGDGSGPYAAALAAELGHPGLDQLNLFQNVKESVIASTGGEQQPWENNGLTRRVYLTGEPTTPADMALWESVRTTNDPQALQTYLERFPTGVFASTARQMIDRLTAEAAQRAAAAKSEIERKAQQAKQTEQLQKAVDEARKAREELSLAQEKQAKADSDAEQAKAAVAAALADREAIAAREQQLRREQQELSFKQAEASKQSTAEVDAAKTELENKLRAATAELQVARESLTAAEAKQTAKEKAAQEARAAPDAESVRRASAASKEAQVAVLTPPPNAPGTTPEVLDGEAGETALNMSESVRAKIQAVLIKRGAKIGFAGGIFGKDSRETISAWQQALGHRATGFVTAVERDALIAEFRKAGPQTFTMALPLEPDDLGPSPDPRLARAVTALSVRPIRYAFANNRVYIAVQHFQVNWQDAAEEAKAAGGQLASLDTPGLLNLIYSLFGGDDRYLDDGGDGTLGGPWVGLVRDPSAKPPKQGWHWLNGSKLALGNWAPGQPNFGTGRDNCGHFFSPGKRDPRADQRANKLDDMACDHVMPGYVMELAPAPSEALPTPAPQQAVLSVPALPVEATATEDSEAGLGMDVGVRAKIQAVLAKRGAKLADVGGLFGDDTRAAIKSWQGGQGALATGYLAAGERDALLAEFRNKGPLAFPYFLRLTVDDLGPSPEPRLVKAVEALSHYPIRYVYVGGELFIDVIAFGIDWKGSKELAERAGGRLAIISSAAVNDAVVKLLEGNRSYYQIYENPHRGKSYNGPWIGLSRDPSQPPPFAGWHWIDGSKVAYRKWAEGQPLVWAPDVTDDCAHLIGPLSTDPKIYAHTNKWASVNCEYIYNSLVIEVPK